MGVGMIKELCGKTAQIALPRSLPSMHHSCLEEVVSQIPFCIDPLKPPSLPCMNLP